MADTQQNQTLDLSKFKFEGGYAPETVVQQVQHMAKSGFSPQDISQLVGKMTLGELSYDPTAGLIESPTSWVREYVKKESPADFGGIASYAAAQGLSDQDVYNALQPYMSYGAAYNKSGLGGIHSLQQLSNKLNWRGTVNPAVAADIQSYSEPASVAQYAIANGIVNRYTGEVENQRALDALTKTYDLDPKDVADQIDRFTDPYVLVNQLFEDKSPVEQVVSTESLEQKIGDREPGFVYNPLAVARSNVYEGTPSELSSVQRSFATPNAQSLRKLLSLIQRMNTMGKTQKFAEGGLSSRTRQFMMEDDPSFNLGMNANAFRNLGMGELADIQNLGLMGLPGANTTVANPEVMSQLSEQTLPKTTGFAPDPYKNLSFQLFGAADAPPPTVEDLYKTVLGRASDPEGLQFWSSKLGPTVQKNELEEFYNAALPELAKTGYVPLKATGPTEVSAQYPEGYDMSSLQKTTVPTIPAADMPPEPKEITDVDFAGAAPAVDTSNFPKFEGKPYDPAAYDNIVKQLTAQQQALSTKGIPYASTFGGPTETIQDMAKRLAAMGISDIRDFGMKHELPVEKVYETIPSDEGASMTFDTGRYRTVVGQRGNDAEGNPIFDYRDLTPEEVEKLKFRDGMGFLPTDQIKRADLKNSPYATTVYYNKKTGEQIDTRQFGGKAESGLFASSGAGDGYTNYRVVYDEKTGTPIFVPEKQLSGMKEFIAEDLSGILSVLRFIPGAQIPVMLAQAAAAAYMGAKPEDILKRAATTYLASNIGKLGDKFLPQLGFEMPTSDLGKMALQSGYSGLASLIQGGDLEDVLKSAGMSAIGTGISGLLPKGGEGDINYGKLIQAAAPALAKGKLTNADIFRILSSLTTPTKPIRGGR